MNSSCRFGTFDHLKVLVSGGQGVLSPGQRMLCGLGAGVTEAVLVVTWIETLKAQLRSERHPAVHNLFLNMWCVQNHSRQSYKLMSA